MTASRSATTNDLYVVLQERGYAPHNLGGTDGDWFDRKDSHGSVRLVVNTADECTDVHRFERGGCAWSVRFTPSAPVAVIAALFGSAERD